MNLRIRLTYSCSRLALSSSSLWIWSRWTIRTPPQPNKFLLVYFPQFLLQLSDQFVDAPRGNFVQISYPQDLAVFVDLHFEFHPVIFCLHGTQFPYAHI
jgi:hypothetical protein